MIAARRRTKAARIDFREVIADRTKNDTLFHVAHRGYQSLQISIRNTHDVKRETLSGFVSDARQAFEFVDEFGDWFRVLQHRWLLSEEASESGWKHAANLALDRLVHFAISFIRSEERRVGKECRSR